MPLIHFHLLTGGSRRVEATLCGQDGAGGTGKSQHWLYANPNLRMENKKAEGADRREAQR